jgi:hypothetical protein
MRSPFTLIPDNLSSDTVECLEQLLERAKRGEVIGLAFAAMLRQRNYIVNSAGEVRRNPTFGLGMVRVLDDELMRKILTANA